MDASEIEAQDLHDKRMARKARERGWRIALEQIRDGLADTRSTPGQRMTLMTKADAYEIARAALSGEG